MLIVLPPSETKALGGSAAPLALENLSFAKLNPIRASIAADLVALSQDPELAMATLKLGPRLAAEVDHNAELAQSPTMPAIERYTGVLYDALGAADLDSRSRARLAVGSALFGMIGANDPIPHYRLSASVRLPAADGSAVTTLKQRWGNAISEVLATQGFVIDLRSGAYANLGKVKGATTLRVLTADGKVVSHFNKHYKGLFARALARATEIPTNAHEAVEIGRAAVFNLTLDDGGLTFHVPAND